MGFVRGFKKFSDGVDKVCLAIIVVMLGTMVAVTIAQIVCRTWFQALQWSEELNRYLLVWSTFLGASCVYKEGSHIAITFVQGLFPPKARKWIQLLVHVICLVTFCAVVYYGWWYAGRMVQKAPSLHIQMKYMYWSIPLGFSLMAIHAVNAILQLLWPEGGKSLS